MTDYLEELLDLLPQEDEEDAAEIWETQAASLPLPKALEAEAPEGAPELPERMAAETMDTGEGGEGSWQEREPAPVLDTALNQEVSLSDSSGEMKQAFVSGGERPVMGEDGPAETGAVLLEQVRSRNRPVLLRQAQDLERQVVQAQALAQDRRSRSLASALAIPSRGQASSPFRTAERSGGGQPISRDSWPGGENPARLVDRAFQRDSRRYDRGFSLY